jgi:YHS domain-containing protein
VLALSASVWASSELNLNKEGIALEGYDPVSYFDTKGPVPGKSDLKVQNSGATYLFASAENKQKFEKEPQKYMPQFGGWCAYAVADSKSKVEVDPKSFIIQDGKLLLFYNGVWADTRDKWQHTKDKTAVDFLKTAQQNWPETKNKEP